MGAASAMVIAQQNGDSGYYVFGAYAEEWSTETDTWHEDLEAAVEQLNWEYRGLSENLVWYISPDEIA